MQCCCCLFNCLFAFLYCTLLLPAYFLIPFLYWCCCYIFAHSLLMAIIFVFGAFVYHFDNTISIFVTDVCNAVNLNLFLVDMTARYLRALIDTLWSIQHSNCCSEGWSNFFQRSRWLVRCSRVLEWYVCRLSLPKTTL